jgi:hypothetical protein
MTHYTEEISHLHSILEFNNLDYFEMVDYSKWNLLLSEQQAVM